MTSRSTRLIALMITAALCGLPTIASIATAAPAPWFRYQSIATGRYVCSQVDLGPYYVKFSGPWANAGCRD